MSQKPTTKEETFLSFIRERFQKGAPDAKQKFSDKFEGGVDFEVSPTKTIEEDQGQEQSYFIDEASKECGLTKEEYEFLLSDIEQAIEDGNRKYGFGESGTIDRDGNFYPFLDADKPRKFKDKKISPEDLAITRGIIKIHRPNPVEIEKEKEEGN